MSNQSVYNKLTTIGNSVDSIRDLVGEDLKQNLDCATIEELPDLVKQAISNNRNYQGAYIFTYDADCELPPEGL